MSFGYILRGTPLARPPTGWHSVGRVSGTVVVASHLHSWIFLAITSFLQFFSWLKVM